MEGWSAHYLLGSGKSIVTLFEYISVAASLICSFVAVRLLGGASAILQAERRYWVHAFFVVIGVIVIMSNWWIFWSFREVDWTYVRFLVALLPLGLMYVQSTLLVPADTSAVRSWRDYYYQVRVRFFALAICYIASLVLTTVVLLGHPILHPRRAFAGTLIAVYTVGMVSDSPRVHATIAVTLGLLGAVSIALLSRPGAFAVPS
jgi:hypothetical protein